MTAALSAFIYVIIARKGQTDRQTDQQTDRPTDIAVLFALC